MSAHLFRAVVRTAFVAFPVSILSQQHERSARCDAQNSSSDVKYTSPDHEVKIEKPVPFVEGMNPDEQGDFHNLFPKRQLWQPKKPYPLWDDDWDGQHPAPTGDHDHDRRRMRHIRKHGVTRHIILIRHGQYDESHKDDDKRRLTGLGRLQAELTGKRLAELMAAAVEDHGPCNIKVLRVSDLTRAKETADIISTYLPNVPYAEPDPLLNEGRPCHTIPGGKMPHKLIEATDHNHPRIERAFRKYFYRAPFDENDENSEQEGSQEDRIDTPKHEFEIIVCHANVIRYFLCRALQLPPEAWLRYCPFNCSLTYLTIRPTGSVSCRMLGDIGHLPFNASTFSMHHGYNW